MKTPFLLTARSYSDAPWGAVRRSSARGGLSALPRERSPDILWRDAGDGSLYAVVKNQPYRAIPMAAWGLPTERMVEKRTINGVEYAIFALKDGKIV